MRDHRTVPARRTHTLRRTWVTTVVLFATIVVAVMGIAVAVTAMQRSAFEETTSSLEIENAALAALDRTILEAVGPMTAVLYRLGDDVELAQSKEQYAGARQGVSAAFRDASAALHSSQERKFLAAAHRSWNGIDGSVMSSSFDYTDEDLVALLRTGVDPFEASVWAPYLEMDGQLAATREATVTDLRQQLTDLEAEQRGIVPVFVATFAGVLVLGWFTVRRISRQVLTPLSQLTHGAVSMSDVGTAEPIEVDGAVAEIEQLARTMNETAVSLRISHGLLDSQAHTDSLTALPNRKAFTERLHAMFENPRIGRVAVMFIDLDDFKDVNDSLGHAAGDELLRFVALRLQAATRGCEIVARLGGDEFAVALDVTSDAGAGPVVAERILDTIKAPLKIEGSRVEVGCSIGIATADANGSPGSEPGEQLLANADFAMYMAKSQGKNRFELHSAAMHTQMVGRMELRRDLAMALAEQQFELHYQPMLDLDTNRLIGFEALIRWQHPTKGTVAPDEFIGIAEDTGAIVAIGDWVIDEACATLAELHREDHALIMSVNVAPTQLTEVGFARKVVETTRHHGVAPDRLVLEITESTAMTNTEEGVRTLNDLRIHGVHIALDDFGTGFSSLRYLGDLPADVIKIDRSFVAGRGRNEESMLESIITLAHRLGLRVVAEGIEVSDDLDRLRGFGELAGQGFLFAHPMPASEIAEYRKLIAAAGGRKLDLLP